MAGFAANSLLCRAALGAGRIDAASFTALRIVAGAAALAAIVRGGRGRAVRAGGSWGSALALFAYALAFSIAYLRIPAGVGALVLFGAVQATMIGWGLLCGERPTRREWLGLALAVGGLCVLSVRGLDAPDPEGVALMAAAGAAWGVYSLRGRRAGSPLATTAGNFARSVPLALGACVLWFLRADLHLSPRGALLAVTSGAVTSGICYSLWYAALPGLSATRAAIAQLSVPLLAALGGVAFLGEAVTPRLVVSGGAILGGVAIAMLGRRRA